jgi:ribose/xylose/arabinose/galactoside ABC-type transport system permease subunit
MAADAALGGELTLRAPTRWRQAGVGIRRCLTRNPNTTGLAVVLVALLIVGTFSSNFFLTSTNLLNVVRQASITALLGLGVTLALIAGKIDFSVGSIAALASVVIGLRSGADAWLTIVVLVALVVVFGVVKGILTSYFHLESLITTLGLALVLDGISYAASKQQLVPVTDRPWRWLGSAEVGGVPVVVITLLVVVLLTSGVLKLTVWGKYLYAAGANPRAAEIAGVRVRRVQLGALVAATALAVLAGVVFVGRVSAGDPTIGTSLALDAIVVAVLGGASLFGGRGSPLGLLLAALLLGVVFNLFNLLNLHSYWQMVARGVILVGAVSMDGLSRRRA